MIINAGVKARRSVDSCGHELHVS